VAPATTRAEPPKGLRASAIRVSVEAADREIGQGVPEYDLDRDARVRALPSFPDWAARLARVRRIRPLDGADALERIARAWVYQQPRFTSPATAWIEYGSPPRWLGSVLRWNAFRMTVGH
jgi:hypothetical protein